MVYLQLSIFLMEYVSVDTFYIKLLQHLKVCTFYQRYKVNRLLNEAINFVHHNHTSHILNACIGAHIIDIKLYRVFVYLKDNKLHYMKQNVRNYELFARNYSHNLLNQSKGTIYACLISKSVNYLRFYCYSYSPH